MKKIVLIAGLLTLCGALSLRAYFAFTPPPEGSKERQLKAIVPASLPGWEVTTQKMGETPESSARVRDFLNFDDGLFRTFRRGSVIVGLYIAYWSPGKVSYRWAGAHTPETCWVQAGWEQTDRKHDVPIHVGDVRLKSAEFGTYVKDRQAMDVYFWHLVGGEVYGYEQQGTHNIFGSLIDLKEFGLDQRREQYFVRLSTNRPLDELKEMRGFERIVASLEAIGLELENAGTYTSKGS